MDVADARIGQQRQSGRIGKTSADEKVAVAGHEENCHAGSGQVAQCVDDAGVERVRQIVVAGPVVEQVAEDGQAAGGARRAGEEGQEARNRRGGIRGQMQVGNEKRCPGLHGIRKTTSAFSITTSSTGTSW